MSQAELLKQFPLLREDTSTYLFFPPSIGENIELSQCFIAVSHSTSVLLRQFSKYVR
ncbi:hypothetical protein Fmac_010139 [Flemingia macrophylla]|uniref:Uncharacterized protein n=1 Tax=Flemingia macrophylla TaxID=520843 RepID=A0ABD1N276_9FABA